MRSRLVAILAVAGWMSGGSMVCGVSVSSAFAADRQVDGDHRNPEICREADSGTAKLSPSVDGRPILTKCSQPRQVSLVAERALAQTGLAIGLASTVLQSQIAILEALVGDETSCTSLTGGGSVLSNGSGGTVTVYYGNGCTQPYIVATPNITAGNGSGDTFVIAETALYYGTTGSNIGSLTLNETAAFNDDGSVNLYGLGIFTPVSGARTPVQLGLYCAIPSETSAQCGGGVAQNFPTLGLAIGAVTPLNLSLDLEDPTAPVSFTGGGSAVTGPVGSLTLTNPGLTSLAIQGGAAFSTTTASGSAAEFALFPPTPTSWKLADPTHGQEFSISVVDNTVRNLTLKITDVGKGGTLALGAVDHSGSGTITYSDGSTAVITNWTLAD